MWNVKEILLVIYFFVNSKDLFSPEDPEILYYIFYFSEMQIIFWPNNNPYRVQTI